MVPAVRLMAKRSGHGWRAATAVRSPEHLEYRPAWVTTSALTRNICQTAKHLVRFEISGRCLRNWTMAVRARFHGPGEGRSLRAQNVDLSNIGFSTTRSPDNPSWPGDRPPVASDSISLRAQWRRSDARTISPCRGTLLPVLSLGARSVCPLAPDSHE